MPDERWGDQPPPAGRWVGGVWYDADVLPTRAELAEDEREWRRWLSAWAARRRERKRERSQS